MDSTKHSRRGFVSELGDENRKFYGSPDGRALLSVIELTFDHRWVYLYELVQNALDVGASSIAIRISATGEALTFQHNGSREFNERDVEGLSKIFRSTKGARSVGFMGIGFKSVFVRFYEAMVSGWGWRFRYETTQVVGEKFGDKQRDLLGAVIPIWDERIALPENGYTTRFEMRRRTDDGADLKSDVARLLPEDDRTPLAILAMSDLKRLEIDGRIWELGVTKDADGSFEVTALSDNENRLWRVFAARFMPSKEAIACFLEHRRIQPDPAVREQVYDEAARPRRVLGVLPLDNDGMPEPPSTGHVYATLPTEDTLPFGLHINADWLLNISRKNLRAVEDNPWQRHIIDKIAEILAHFLEWSAKAHSQRPAATAAFKVLRRPSPEADGIESLIAADGWLSTLRDHINDAAVVPVWTKATSNVAYAKPADVLVPPGPLATAFESQPALKPAILFNRPVLMTDVLGSRALEFFRSVTVLAEMSPSDLEDAWYGGLDEWWTSIRGEEGFRRKLLVRLWAAIGQLSADDRWNKLDVRCIRSATGAWIAVDEAVFLNEALPTDDEPGGSETRGLMQAFVPNANRLDSDLIATLRQRKNQGHEQELIFEAWSWIEHNARGISLRELVVKVFEAETIPKDPNWSAFASFGHWAKHRNRPDLLIHVVVQSHGSVASVPIGKALLADPYVDHGESRRRLWTDVPAIAGVYFQQDPKSAGAHDWRTFFEKAGAKGALEVRSTEITATRWETPKVARFLGRRVEEIPQANDQGYRLLDFRVVPEIPAPDTPKELRAAIAPCLEDSIRILEGKGKRKVTCFYYSPDERNGSESSAWARQLSDLAWVPCYDETLRRPRDVLPESDPAREDAPVADLSAELVNVLEREGVGFGAAVPELTSVRRLIVIGSQLDADELAGLLAECRKDATEGIDRQLFDQSLDNLLLPTTGGERVAINRIVQRVGGGLRASLGGWIVPLDDIEETLRGELEDAEFPREFPVTTTGEQALGYIVDVWRRARSSPEGLANKCREFLPTAYGYCLEDTAKDASLLKRWREAVSQAAVFSEREWIALSEVDDTYFDDIEDRRFLPRQVKLRTVTAGHLGRGRIDQLCTAKAIGLRLLSSVVNMEWVGGDKVSRLSDVWVWRFECICELLRKVRGSEPLGGDAADNGTSVRLIHASELSLSVSVDNSSIEAVPVNARLHEGTLTVAGRPAQFGADAAKELLRHFSFGQRAGLAADLTGMFVAIESTDFGLAAEKFCRSHVPDVEALVRFKQDLRSSLGVGSEPKSEGMAKFGGEATRSGADGNVPFGGTPASDVSERGDGDQSRTEMAKGPMAAKGDESEDEESVSTGGSYVRERALARQNALADQLRKSLKGEISPGIEEDDAVEAVLAKGDKDKGLGDEEYREIAARYEKEAGREPEIGDPHQSGWDIRSIDRETEEVRLIEVKGKGCPWENNEVVELSVAQIRKAFETTESWYLYVVEKTQEGGYQVLPIRNPARAATKWMLCGKSWRMVAEQAKSVDSLPN